MFNLPTYQELSEEQDAAINLPSQSNYLVTGPPGSGKTVIAIYRAEMLKDVRKDYMILVYNRTLNQYMRTILREKKLEGNSITFDSWFWSWFKKTTGRTPPLKEANAQGWKDYDWNAILQSPEFLKPFTKFNNIILDEGQDFPRELYMVLRLIAENCSIFADENQRLRETNSTIADIRANMGIPEEEEIKLKKNYRNTIPIAKLAACFYNGLPGWIPELPTRDGIKPKLLQGDKHQQIKRIAVYVGNNPTKTIGVMVHTSQELINLYNGINALFKGSVQMFYPKDPSKQHSEIDFTIKGIFLFAYASAKGLQFDTVFLPHLEDIRTDKKIDDLKMTFYVLTARAREELYLLSDGSGIPFVLKKVPEALYDTEKLKES